MSAAHTPGSWGWHRLSGGGFRVTGQDPKHPDVGIRTVAVVDGNLRTDEENYRNTRLIAAAPELLEALKTMLDAFVEDPLDANTDAAVEKAYAAIEQATDKKKLAGYGAPFWNSLEASMKKARGQA